MADRGLLNENHCSLPLLSKVKFSAIRNSNVFLSKCILLIFLHMCRCLLNSQNILTVAEVSP